MTAIASVAAGGPHVRDHRRTWARAPDTARRPLRWARAPDAVRELVAPWAAGAALLGPKRWWVEGYVLLNALSQSAAARAGRGLALRVLESVRGALLRFVADARGAVRELVRPRQPRRWHPTPRGALRALVWTTVVTCVGAFAASLAVPAWHGLRGQQLLIVTSGSMSPFVEAGDAAVLQSIEDPSQLRVGQVVTFWPPGSQHLLTHRIVDLQMLPVLEEGPDGRMVSRLNAAGEPITRPYVYTKGDANRTRDPNATPLSLVRGVVVASHPGWGRWLGWAQSPTGRLIMLAPPLVLLGALEIVESLAERRAHPARRTAAHPEVTDAPVSL